MMRTRITLFLALVLTAVGTLTARAQEAYAALSDDNTTLTFYYDALKESRGGMDIGPFDAPNGRGWDAQCESITTAVFDESFADYTGLTSTACWFTNCTSLTTVTGISNLKTDNVTSLWAMFYNCSALTGVDVTGFNTANVTDMNGMFYNCSALTSVDVSEFDVSIVESMDDMFNNCSSLVTIYGDEQWSCQTSSNMFKNCTSLTGAISYNSSKTDVTYANPTTGYFTSTGKTHIRPYAALSASNTVLTFYYDGNKTARNGLDLKKREWYAQRSKIYRVVFDESFADYTNLTSTAYWFDGCNVLRVIDGIEHLNTAKVTDMTSMFYGCSSLTSLDVSRFKTANVTSMTNMFYNCSALVLILCNNTWTCSFSIGMFHGCTSLKGAIEYDPAKTTATYANPETGYFTHTPAEPYAVLSDDNKTLTFYFDYNKENRNGFDVGPFSEASERGWYAQRENITTVVFDEAFAYCKTVTSTAHWFNGCSALTTITGIERLNTKDVTSMNSMFRGCKSLSTIDLSSFNTDNVTDMYRMFYGCKSLSTIDLSSFNTANVTDMGGMFRGCTSLTALDFSSFNTANVMDMSYMFTNCSALTTLDLNSFNTTNVTDMTSMFYSCSGLTAIYCDNTWSCAESENMFFGCTSLKGAIAYDAGKTDVNYANPKTGYFTGRIPYAVLSDDHKTLTFYYDLNKESRGGMDVGPFSGYSSRGWNPYCNVITTVVFDKAFAEYNDLTSTAHWFRNCSALTTITGIEHLNTQNVTTMERMFYGCKLLTDLDVSHFNTANVTTVSQMFFNCSALTSLDVTGFETGNMTNMGYMFRGCSGLTVLDVNNFNVGKVTEMNYMFKDCSNLTAIYCTHIWNCPSSKEMFAGCEKLKGTIAYDEGKTDVNYANPEGYFTAREPYAALSNGQKTLTFYYDNQRESREGFYFTALYGEALEREWDIQSPYITTVVFDESFADYKGLTSTALWFNGFHALTTITGLEFLNTQNVTDMKNMFDGCYSLTTLDVSGLNTANVSDMTGMFNSCSELTTIYCDDTWSCDISEDMFSACTKLKGAIAYDPEKTNASWANPVSGYFTYVPPKPYALLSDDNMTLTFYCDYNKKSRNGMNVGPFSEASDRGWHTQRENIITVVFDESFADYTGLTSTAHWFNGCNALTNIDGIKRLNTANVTTMNGMFRNCSTLTNLDVTGFITGNVTDMYRMFYGCSGLTTIDLSSFDTAKVTDMSGMFRGCTSLTTILCNRDWSTSAVLTSSENMFFNCNALVGGKGTTYNSSNTDVTYARPDDGTEAPGYFTAFLKGDANGDGSVTITDAVAIVNKILGNASDNFNKAAADVNGDGEITITDAVGVVNIILNNVSE